MVDLFRLKGVTLAAIKRKNKSTIPTVKLKHLSGDSSYGSAYESSSFCFAACSDLSKGSVTQLFHLNGCREGFIRQYKSCALGHDDAAEPAKKRTSLMVWINKGKAETAYDYSKNTSARLNMSYEDWMDKSMKVAVMMLNRFEARNSWMRTKVYKADHKLSTKNIIYYFRGSRWWQFAPHTFSLFMLLIRLSKHTDLHEMRNNVTPEIIVKNILQIKGGHDKHHAETAGNWLTLMDNRRAIYKGRSFKTNWEAFTSGSEGVRKLTDGEAADQQTQQRFNKFKK